MTIWAQHANSLCAAGAGAICSRLAGFSLTGRVPCKWAFSPQVWSALFGDSMSGLAVGRSLVVVAGLYQFFAGQEGVPEQMPRSADLFHGHWRGPIAQGCRLVGSVLGCCWALMLLAFGAV